jgi:branched-chain amino acid transport system ATP-binding protein
MSKDILKLENIKVKYGDFVAVDGVTMNVKEGHMVSVIGLNGSGKTSLMNAVAGLTKISEGKVYLGDEDVTGYSSHKMVSAGLSLVPQGGHCFNRMTVLDNLIVGSYKKSARADKQKNLEKVFELFQVLAEKKDMAAGSLSGGQRQMVAIGRALMSNPKIILFDELSLGLAPVVVKDIYATIKKINEIDNTTIVLIEQDTRRAIATTDYSYIMLKGKVLLEGDATDLSDEDIKKAYFGI